MQTGCQGPYVNGTGGYCGCNCKCCPPPCCPVISVYFQCGAPYDPDTNPGGCEFTMPMVENPLWANLVPKQLPELPEFSKKPIRSMNGRFTLGTGSVPCSVPCADVCVPVMCGGNSMPCCCLQLTDGIIYAVGNGYVTAPTTVTLDNDCISATVMINGMPPPVLVSDGDAITITLTPEDEECCSCSQVDIACASCPDSMGFAVKQIPLLIRKTDPRSGKVKLNPKTGKPIITINLDELRRRIINRSKNSRRSGK